MKGRFDNKRAWDQKGVSEVVGTLLILGLTVVLFSSMILMVGNIPAPTKGGATSLEGKIEPKAGDWSQGAYINVTNKGGIILRGLWTNIILTIGGSSNNYYTRAANLSYGIDGADEDWEIGETWTYTVGPGILTSSTPVSIMVVATDRNAVVWMEDLMAAGSRNYPPVIMEAYADSDLNTDEHDFVRYNETFWVFVRVVDFDGNMNPDSVYADLREMNCGWLKLDDGDLDNVYSGSTTGPVNPQLTPTRQYNITFNATDYLGNSSKKTIQTWVGGEIGFMPEIYINSGNITFSDETPVHNQKLEIIAIVRNFGLGSVEADVRFYDGSKTPANLVGNRTVPINLHANGQVNAIIDWTPLYGGDHLIIVNVTPVDPVADFNWTNNEASVTIPVLPTILLVDDDGHANDRSEVDTSSFMRGALSACNFEYDFTSISVGSGPRYDKGDYALIKYDVVIWMTGYATSSTLTAADVQNVSAFLSTGTNAGSLWMISQGMYDEAATASYLQTFITNLLHTQYPAIAQDPMDGPIRGVYGDQVSNYTWNGNVLLTQRGAASEKGWQIQDDATPFSFSSLKSWDNASTYAVGFEDQPIDSRIYFTPWEFSRIKYTSDQAQLAYEVIRWLGGINSTFGRDLAVSQQTIDRTTVFYRQPVNITGIVRNNGRQAETNVEVSATVYYNAVPVWSNETTVNVSNVAGQNWIPVGPFTWTPTEIGPHSIVIMVDPRDDIAESNEDNNVISDYLSAGNIIVQYRILIVDDDDSANNNGARSNETANVTKTFDTLGYFDRIDGFWVVDHDEPGPTATILKDYNAVIWSTGVDDVALLANDTIALVDYLNTNGSRLWMIGAGGLINGDPFNSYLGLTSVTRPVANPAYLLGIEDDPVSHGIRYRMNASASRDVLVPSTGTGILRQSASAFNGVSYSTTGYKAVTCGFLLSDLFGTDLYTTSMYPRVELAYMVMHWFGMPDDRVELRIFAEDLFVSEDHPELGDSYVLQAQVKNVGGSDGNALVRFIDGTTQIGSDSISVSADGKTTAEVIWTPLFAGLRTVKVIVDPLNETGEIMDWFNNQASFTTYVYFFYDDMESPADSLNKWSHESTTTLINGEEPLDYFINTALDMNIEKSWDWTVSRYVENCTDTGFYHTYNTSYWLQEPAGGTGTVQRVRDPMDIVFCLDTSTSMDDALGGSTKIDQLKVATRNFIGFLTDTDRAAIYKFDGAGNPQRLRDWAWMIDANQTSFNTSVTNIATADATPFYDTLGASINYARTYDATCTDRTRYEYVIALTDGQSNRDDTWTPNCDWGTTMTDNQYTNGGANVAGMQGLRKAPPMVYTVGLGTNHDPLYPLCNVPPGFSYTPPRSGSGYDQEFDLWNCANSTPVNPPGGNYGWNNTTTPHRPLVGHYYYCNDAGQLPNLFATIFSSISRGIQLAGENVTRSADPVLMSMPVGDGEPLMPEPPEANAYTSYDYSTTTTAGPHNAWFVEVDDNSDNQLNNGNGGGYNELTNAQYTNVGSSNNVRATAWDPGMGDHIFFKCDFLINEVAADITQINLTFEGYGVAATDFQIWAYNYVTLTWGQIGTAQAFGAGTAGEATMTRNIVANCAQYISGTSRLLWGVYQVDTSDDIGVDFARVGIIYTSTARATATGPVNLIGTNIASPTITYSTTNAPTSVEIYWSSNGGTTWTLWGTDASVDGSWIAGSPLLVDGWYNWSARGRRAGMDEAVPVGAAAIEPPAPSAAGYRLDLTPPIVINTQPANGTTNVQTNLQVRVTFNERMSGAFTPTLVQAPGPPAIVYTWVGWATTTYTNDTAVWNHAVNWDYDTNYTLSVSAGRDYATNLMVGSHNFTFRTSRTATATATGQTNLFPTNVNPTITYTVDGWPTSVEIYYTIDSGFTWTLLGTDASVDGVYAPPALVTSGTYGWIARAMGGGSLEIVPPDASGIPPEASPYYFDIDAPFVQGTAPSSGQNNVARGALVTVRFNERMRTSIQPTIAGGAVAYSFIGWQTYSLPDDTAVWSHTDWAASTTITLTISAGRDYAGNVQAAPYAWSFMTGVETGSGGGGGGNEGKAPPGINCNKSAVTKSMDLTGYAGAKLSFWHKYNIVPGANGGVLMVGFYNSTAIPPRWQYLYVIPSSAYTGNLRINATTRVDDFGTFIRWGWNGVSGHGTFTWEKVSFDILQYVPSAYRSQVRVKFQYYQYGGGTGYGWYIDDVRISVNRSDAVAPGATTADVWKLVSSSANPDPAYPAPYGTNHTHSGRYAWWNGDPTTSYMKPGVDNSLMTGPIDLTNARNATLKAYFKFNVNNKDGAPPDGFRVEISKDNGASWIAMNLGVRASWNVSGTDLFVVGGRSYSGVNVGNNWVTSGSLLRLNCDLTPFIGNAILMRFRIVNNNIVNPAFYAHYKSDLAAAGFGGFYVDDVTIVGNTILG